MPSGQPWTDRPCIPRALSPSLLIRDVGTLAAPPGGGAGGPVSGAQRGCSWADRASYPAAWPRKQVVGVDGAMWGPQHHCPGGPVSPSPSITARGSSSPSITVPGSCLALPRITVPGVWSPPPQHHCPGGPVSPSPSITVLGVLSPPPPASLSWGSLSAPDQPPPPPASLLGGLSPQGCRVGVCAVVSGRVFFPRAVESQGLAGRQEASSGSHGAHCLLRVRSLGLESTFRREHSESQFH